MSGRLRIAPLGGLGEVGMNCMCLETRGRLLVIDCGVTFPDREPGVDIIHPSFEWLRERASDVEAVFLTHGHEDHVGALPFLLEHVDVPVLGPPYALAHARARIGEHLPSYEPRFVPTAARTTERLGPFQVTPYQVAHSIPDAHGLCIDTPVGRVVHSGDFKIDGEGVDGPAFDEAHVREIGDAGVRLLMSDSTNVEVPGSAGGEGPVAEAIEARIAAAKQRVVVCMFASNVERLGAVLRAAHAHGRKVLLLGRSLLSHWSIGEELGLLRGAQPELVALEDAAAVPRGRLLVVATGSQGEPAAALPRLAFDTQHKLSLEAGDEVILSSRIIPGRERDVYAVMSALERRDIHVWTRTRDPSLHVSGHGGRAEQRKLIEWLRPAAFVPIHGTLLHLQRHAELARELGVTPTLVVENGALLELDDAGLRVAGSVPVGRVHRQAGGEVPGEVLGERGRMARMGLVVVALPVDGRGEPRGKPEIRCHGVPEGPRGSLAQALERAVQRALRSRRDGADLSQVAGRAARRTILDVLGVRPVIDVVITQIDP